MLRSRFLIVVVLACLVGTQVGWSEVSPETKSLTLTLCQQAKSAEQEDRFQDAEGLYRQVLALTPENQNAAYRLAICQQKAGKLDDSIASFDRAIAINPKGYWAEVALYFRASTCQEAGRNSEALDGIQQLRSLYPESSYIARARVLKSKITGKNEAIAEAALERELRAGAVFDEGMQFANEKDNDRAIQRMDEVIARYPDCAVALRARERKGYLLLRDKKYEEAMDPFLQILSQTQELYPDARITQSAKTRVAAILHALKRREEAIDQYLELLESDCDPEIQANAALQTVGLAFEICQRRRVDEGPLPDKTWEELRTMCEDVKKMPAVTEEQKVRADLMRIELFSWQEDRENSLESAEAFIQEYDPKLYRMETATAHLVAGQALRHLKRYDEAIEHLQWIVDEYEDEEYIWKDMDHLPKSYFYIYLCLREKGAPKSEVNEAGDELQKRFPDSPYSEHVRLMKNQKGWGE